MHSVLWLSNSKDPRTDNVDADSSHRDRETALHGTDKYIE